MLSARIMHAAFGLVVLALLNAGAVAFAQQEETGWGRHKRMFAVPAPGKVTIDGKFDDWDLSARLETYVMAATRDMQCGRLAVMYDADALYIGAEVRDTTPMMNRQSPEANGETAWDADSLQFRLSVDPDLGYPLTYTSWNREPNDQVVHLLLWYYTDRREPNLQIQTGMNYAIPPWCDKFGVVPRNMFEAAYLMAPDKKGYTLEYRIPWRTLGARKPPTGGDIVAATYQFNFGRPDGLKTAGYSGWAYDLQAYVGFAYQNSGCWGKLVFSKEGNLPRELVEEGVPPTKPRPLVFEYDLPEDAEVTIALYNDRNEIVRSLVTSSPRQAGHIVEHWDGLDDLGRPLPAGTYTWKGLYHQPLSVKHVLSVHNSGQPPWKTDDNTGGWGGDHGVPQAACALGADMLLGWDSAEAGWGIIRVDADGRKKWGTLAAASHIATDGQRVYVASRESWTKEGDVVRLYDAEDGRVLAFGNEAALLKPAPDTSIGGLAVHDGVLYVSCPAKDSIFLYDAAQGNVKTVWSVPKPASLAIRPDGALLTLSNRRLAVVADGRVTLLGAEPLEEPSGIFAPDGKPRGAIGKEGGRPSVGRFDPAGMYQPGGLALDRRGRLWVAESADAPKRISVWDVETGALVKDFFGGAHYSAMIWMDPERPDEVYCDGTIWKIDLDKKTSYPYATIWRPKGDNSPGLFSTHAYGFRTVTAANGRQYGWTSDARYRGPMLLMRVEGDWFKPILMFPLFRPPVMADKQKYPMYDAFVWVDRNDDQMFQESEISASLGKDWIVGRGFTWVDRNLNLWGRMGKKGKVYRPIRFEADGRPVYDFTKPEVVPMPVESVDAFDGTLYTLDPGDPPGDYIGYGHWQANGKMLWGYRGAIAWHRALGMPPQRAGKLWGPSTLLGTAGEFTGLNTYFGCFHIYTRKEGLCVGKIFRDPRLGGGMGPDIIHCENYNGQLVKPRGMDRYFALAGDQDGRISEVFGLQTVRRLEGGTYTLSEADVKKAAEAVTEYLAKKAKAQRLVIVRGRKALDVAQPVEKIISSTRSFTARAAYDDANLYLLYKVTSPSDLINSTTDPRLVFKGGNLLDIQLATDPGADPERKTPAPGDLRILVSRKAKPDGTFSTLAVVFRPKVKGFAGEPIELTSPTGKELFDSIEVTDRIGLEYRRGRGEPFFTAVVTIPLDLIGLKLQPGQKVRMDVGYIYGNTSGSEAMARSYWSNNGFSANVLKDIPNESRLTPAEWGTATVE